ncbi:MAG: hypothetical protein JWQ81_3167 [Amycolatopsis sp.]|jgi:hypothetical protein|uniref:hypothetical protein n=1 Tax=Amycolatopsis sp. TaxID=37632 RepID=UPI00261EA35D|nr:hypothetical protein [Amycolatopsis sp.]MCU1682428.1 hypothetical protein [Amycolatopsis sp.]
MSTRDDGPAGDPRQDPQWDLVRAAARATVPTPPGLIARVLRSIGGVRGTTSAKPLEFEVDGDRVRVDERVVVLLARRLGADLGREIGGVHLSAVALEDIGLQVLITVGYGVVADKAAALLSTRLRAALTKQLGEPAPPVHVHVVDVHPG